MNKDPKDLVMEIVGLVGKPKAERLLIQADLSPSLAGKLVRGKYDSEVGELVAAAIKKAKAAAKAS